MGLLKGYYLFVILFVSVTLSGYAQTVNSSIEKIKKEVESINRSGLEAKSYPYSNKCGVIKASITVYYKNGVVSKVRDTGIGDDDKAANSWNYAYYYEKDILIFSFETRQYYNNETGSKIREEIRQYFAANRLIRQMENGKISFPENIFIDGRDTKYRLKNITAPSDIAEIYPCAD